MNLNSIISKYDGDHVSSPDLNLIKGKTVLGFNKNGRVKIGKLPLEDYLKGSAVALNKTVEVLTDELFNKKTVKARQLEIVKELEIVNEELNMITYAIDLSAKNAIVDLFNTNMIDTKNRKDLLTPISFARIASLKNKTEKELSELLESDEFLFELKEAGLIELEC